MNVSWTCEVPLMNIIKIYKFVLLDEGEGTMEVKDVIMPKSVKCLQHEDQWVVGRCITVWKILCLMS